ncbi:hypothetical protein [Acetobacter ascendens]|uniref:Uncharacterized protein n=1 Tax=Acetobacter ascendens TaxID=481146 RepID=A0A1Y0V9M5_9PROT|nr:hypothetical protein [Acetobacter ascendens]ARW11487.1 hypothetical protein S101447_02449 [Acetobacter ascendens]
MDEDACKNQRNRAFLLNQSRKATAQFASHIADSQAMSINGGFRTAIIENAKLALITYGGDTRYCID